jgi:hypothetical protein
MFNCKLFGKLHRIIIFTHKNVFTLSIPYFNCDRENIFRWSSAFCCLLIAVFLLLWVWVLTFEWILYNVWKLGCLVWVPLRDSISVCNIILLKRISHFIIYLVTTLLILRDVFVYFLNKMLRLRLKCIVAIFFLKIIFTSIWNFINGRKSWDIQCFIIESLII